MFMHPQVTKKSLWLEVETADGTLFFPAESRSGAPEYWGVKEYTEFRFIDGYGCRLSAPGFIDCTEWSVYKTADEAVDSLDEMYGDDSEEWDREIREIREDINREG